MYARNSVLFRALSVFQAFMLVVVLAGGSFPFHAFATQPDDVGHTPVSICHKDDEEGDHVIVVDDNAVEAHLNHGDSLDTEHCGDQDNNDDQDDNDDEDDNDHEDDHLACTLVADPVTITEGDSSTLTLHITGEDADEASASVDNGVGTMGDGDSEEVSPEGTTTYTATVSGEHEDEDSVTCSATVTVNPKEDDNDDEDTTPDNSCSLMDTLNGEGTADVNAVSPDGANAELQEILDGESYGVDVDTDQTGAQVWNHSGDTVHYSAKFIAKFAGDKHVFGYIADGGAFTPVFKDYATFGGDPYPAVPQNGTNAFDVAGANTVVFAMQDITSGKTYVTKTADNFDTKQHAVVYNPADNMYAIGFEDQTGATLGDHDYNDLVVEVTVTGCENDEVPHATIHAAKVICETEADLPNWGDGAANITSATAQAWVDQSEGACHLAPEWDFQWAPGNTLNPGDNVESAGSPWTTFTNSTTIANPNGAKFWFREVLPEGWLQFSGSVSAPRDNVSAEFYCNTDVLNYDNFDWIDPTNAGTDYYCVAFNVAPEVVAPECSDGVDNADVEDELADANDPGCHTDGNVENSESYDPNDNDESDEVTPPTCDLETHHFNNDEECVPNDDGDDEEDVCANIEGFQSEVPSGMHIVNGDQCKKNSRSNGGGGHSGGGEVLGATTCGPLLSQYLHVGWKNDADEVKKLQGFLNTELGLTLPESGLFGDDTFKAVKAFQLKHGKDVLVPWVGHPGSGITGEDTPTGYVYQTTRWQINNIWCPGSEAFPTVLN